MKENHSQITLKTVCTNKPVKQMSNERHSLVVYRGEDWLPAINSASSEYGEEHKVINAEYM